MAIDRSLVAVWAGKLESVTMTVKSAVPIALLLGVPEMTPVEASRLSPAGREPVDTDQV